MRNALESRRISSRIVPNLNWHSFYFFDISYVTWSSHADSKVKATLVGKRKRKHPCACYLWRHSDIGSKYTASLLYMIYISSDRLSFVKQLAYYELCYREKPSRRSSFMIEKTFLFSDALRQSLISILHFSTFANTYTGFLMNFLSYFVTTVPVFAKKK